MFYPLLRKILFSLDPEQAHELTIKLLKWTGNSPLRHLINPKPTKQHDHLATSCMGIKFNNLIGLAAGVDKNAEAINGFAALGFGFIEVGTVTPLPQEGNKKPRQFRLIEVEGIINRNGFNNVGIDQVIENIKKARFGGILGINIGKNTKTSIENSLDDYMLCLTKAYNYASYIAVNVSSPNSPGLRQLQYGDAFDHLLKNLKQKQSQLNQTHQKHVPIAIKIAPDLTLQELIQIADALKRNKIDGVIATNTTLSRNLIKGVKHSEQIGGLSGQPIQSLSTQVIRQLRQELKNDIPIIGCGGINSIESARQKLQAGAQLLQLYSGLVYHGPQLIYQLAKNVNQ